MKDYYDVLLLSRSFPFDGEKLARAIRETFTRRETPVTSDVAGLTRAFAEQPDKQIQWRAFARKIRHQGDEAVADVVARVGAFLQPIVNALAGEAAVPRHWSSDGGWSE